MKGFSIAEMAEADNVPYKTMAQRIRRGEYEPIFDGKLFSKNVFDAVVNNKDIKRGRPPKK